MWARVTEGCQLGYKSLLIYVVWTYVSKPLCGFCLIKTWKYYIILCLEIPRVLRRHSRQPLCSPLRRRKIGNTPLHVVFRSGSTPQHCINQWLWKSNYCLNRHKITHTQDITNNQYCMFLVRTTPEYSCVWTQIFRKYSTWWSLFSITYCL